jgi:diguanylate cyclase (GGDEF)-like protein
MVNIMAQPKLSIIQNESMEQYSNTFVDVNNGLLKKKVRNNNAINDLEVSKQTLVNLSNRLHSHIEIEKLITAFSNEIKPIIHLDDVIYKSPNENSKINNKGRHFCSYNLVFNEVELGEIFFVRRYRFVEDENYFIEKLLVTLLSPLSNAIKYNNAIKEAQTDPLTGALNRSGMEKGFKREMELARRNKNDLSILLLDIDFFKKINDSYGHDFGDTVLKGISTHIKSCIRNTDVFARFGGEEFVVLLNNTSRSGALLLAERIRQKIEKTSLKFNSFNKEEEDVSYTASIGVATLKETDDRDIFFNRVDRALYEAKGNGRNRVVLSQG